ncbi:unnamed protein product [Linum trigynum]|uniref:CCHC-type domain-containing protein n=1 Tax=Linum trigynum TaxID=586398 RepID=A0AAV2DDV2_9ROSI
MLEGIRGYVMDRVVVKYKMLLDSTDVLCPRIRKRVEKEKALARLCTARQTLNDKCEANNNVGGGRGKRPRTAAPNPGNTEPTARKTRIGHCSKCGSTTHNARTCPLNRGVGIQAVHINVGDRRTIEREMRTATRGVGVYVSEETGNQYVILNGSRGRAVGGTQHDEVQLRGSQPPPTQP